MIASLVAGVLIVIAVLHILWGLNIWWPIRSEAALAKAVVGAKGITKMPPPAASFAVAIALLAGAWWALALGGVVTTWIFSDSLVTLGGYALVAVFVLRGIAGYTAFWARQCPEQPFHRLDRLYYSPLCLLLGAGFALLLRQ